MSAPSLEESLLRRNRQLATFNAIALKVNQSLDLEEILGQALEEVLNLAEVDAGAIFLRQENLGSLKLLAHRGLSREAAHTAAEMGMLDSSCGGTVETEQIVIVPDLSLYRGRRANSLRREQLIALIHVPLIAKGSALGSMCLGTRQAHEFAAEEQDLLLAIGSQIAVAIENARLYAELAHKEHMRGELLRKVITAQEDERRRIARELHDDTSQALTALLFAADAALESADPDQTRQMLAKMAGLARSTLDGVHKLIFDLRPTMLDHLGLVPAVRWLAQSRLEAAGIHFKLEEPVQPRRLPSEVETALFRVVQEAITNIARHALARNVSIALVFDEHSVNVTVCDDGIGFDLVELDLAPDSRRGLGLLGMRERASLLGGEVEVVTAPGYGTTLRIVMPVGERDTAHA